LAVHHRSSLRLSSTFGPNGRADGAGGDVHLNRAVDGWVVPGRNPFGVYLYTRRVDAIAEAMRDAVIERGKAPEHKPWGMYEVALNGPDDLLVRVGWPSRLMSAG
jgi:hypothetical protein